MQPSAPTMTMSRPTAAARDFQAERGTAPDTLARPQFRFAWKETVPPAAPAAPAGPAERLRRALAPLAARLSTLRRPA